jgi:hypothetical protein
VRRLLCWLVPDEALRWRRPYGDLLDALEWSSGRVALSLGRQLRPVLGEMVTLVNALLDSLP